MASHDDIQAFLTTQAQAQVVVCERSNCPVKRFPPGTPLFFVHAQSIGAQGDGIAVCAACYAYYQQKAGTVSRSAVRQNSATQKQAPKRLPVNQLPSVAINAEQIRSQVSQAQRGEAVPQKAIGAHTHEALSSVRVAIPTARVPSAVMMPPPSYIPTSTAAGPSFALPYIPSMTASHGQGYTTQHMHYQAAKNAAKHRSLTQTGGHYITLTVSLVRKIPSKPTVNCLNWVAREGVPAHIGYDDLRALAYDMVLPLWNKHSEGWPLAIDDITIASQNCAPILYGEADVIVAQFLRHNSKGGTPTFKTGNYKLYVLVSDEVWEAWGRHEDDSMAEGSVVSGHREVPESELQLRLHSSPDSTTPSSTRQRQMPVVAGKTSGKLVTRKRKHHDNTGSDDEDSESDVRQHAPLRRLKRRRNSIIDLETEKHDDPDSDEAEHANEVPVAGVSPPSGSSDDRTPPITSPLGTRPIKPSSRSSDSTSSASSSGLDDDDLAQLALCLRTQQKPAPRNNVLTEMFPTSFMRLNGSPIIGFFTIKRLIASILKHQEVHQRVDVPRYLLGEEQALTLKLDSMTEPLRGRFKVAQFGTCRPSIFGKGSTVCVKQVLRQTPGGKGPTNSVYEGGKQLRELLPEVHCLVWATTLHYETMFWVSDRVAEYHRSNRPFVDEAGQPIEVPTHLRFVEAWLAKEITSSGSAPRVVMIEECIRTKPTEADTGNLDLLTDPQIVTHPKLGSIFASGNLPKAYESFEMQHQCNRYCRFFKLPADYDAWPLNPLAQSEVEEGSADVQVEGVPNLQREGVKLGEAGEAGDETTGHAAEVA